MAALLRIEAVCCGYDRTDVVHDAHMEVREGETVCLIGPNGAGKSTLMKAIMGAVRVSSGRIVFAGRDMTRASTSARVAGGIAMAPEGRGVLPTLSVEENLLLGAYVRGSDPGVRADFERLTTLFPVLRQRLGQAASTLSGGEQQQLCIARALMSRPRLLILDEPSFGVAPMVVASIFRTIRELGDAGTTILLVEQNAALAFDVAQRGYLLESGRFAIDGPTDELRRSDLVREVYLGAAV